MATNAPDPTPRKQGGLWARLFGMNEPAKAETEKEADAPASNPKEADAPPSNPPVVAEAPPQPPPAATTPEPAAPPLAEPPSPPSPTPAPAIRPEPAQPIPNLSLDAPEEAAVSDAVLEPLEPVPVAIAEPIPAAVAEPVPVVLVTPAQAGSPAPLPVAVLDTVPPVEAELDTTPTAIPIVPAIVLPAVPAEVTPAQVITPPAAPQLCQVCGTPRKDTQPYCDECGFMFSPEDQPAPAAPVRSTMNLSATPAPANLIKGRYELLEQVAERGGVARYRGADHGSANGQAVPVCILRGQLPDLSAELLPADEAPAASAEPAAEEEFLPTFEEPLPAAQITSTGDWPGVVWEQSVLERAAHPALPRVVEAFVEDNYEYLIEELPQGRILWDAWDEEAEAHVRYGWLKQLAEGLHALHGAGAMVEGLRPDLVVVTPAGQAMLADLAGLLPIPLPPGAPIRASLYTAPELVLAPQEADARAELYSFGATLYALEYLHHALEEKDFERQFVPHQITDRYPDVHPAFFRLINKTFVRDVNTRFPTDEAVKEDATGFKELIRTLEVCQRTFDNVRLDMAAWTTTGMVRTGNEDAFNILHAVEARQDDLWEYALILLADGMGGYEAGEVAAAMALQSLRSYLLLQPMFSSLAGRSPPAAGVFQIEQCKQVLSAALKQANKEIYNYARAPGRGRRTMGCTAEVVYIDNRNLVVGHVGDSRTYHVHQGRLVQLTRDQTFVNRMVELGQLTAEEAEDHPRKNELQQAIGGAPDVVPGMYHGRMKRGDWVLVCSDGLTNHIPSADLEKMMLREAASSADEAARRFVNLVNLRGATDNATVVVVRAG